ncbi:DsbA family protein [Thermus tenuipuniceus]|uniref:DsbA family protein n=1 Tax=Thermus tenuipuniceus TaxID=2078690 RepID=UPI000CFA0DF3|nr:thioredoxin domain-containing protein [Thermus tenuipuniceus]
MRALALLLFLGLALAQVAKPVEAFSQAVGPLPPGGRLEVETRNGRLLAVAYQGPKNAAFLARLVEKATGEPFGPALLDWYAKNAKALEGQRLKLNLGEAYTLELALTEPMRARIAPRQVPESAFGQDRLVLGREGPFLRVFSDFQCPYCQRLAQTVLPRLKVLAEQGEVRVSYRHFPLKEIHPEALPAAIASECAHRQGAFWPYHDRLMQGRLGNYLGLARALGLDQEAFARCLEDAGVREAVEGERELALRLGLRGTPTAFAGPFQVPNPLDLERVLDYLVLAR